MSTIFSSFLSRYCETNYRHKRDWRPILDLLECWKNAISRSTLVIKLSSITYSMIAMMMTLGMIEIEKEIVGMVVEEAAVIVRIEKTLMMIVPQVLTFRT